MLTAVLTFPTKIPTNSHVEEEEKQGRGKAVGTQSQHTPLCGAEWQMGLSFTYLTVK